MRFLLLCTVALLLLATPVKTVPIENLAGIITTPSSRSQPIDLYKPNQEIVSGDIQRRTAFALNKLNKILGDQLESVRSEVSKLLEEKTSLTSKLKASKRKLQEALSCDRRAGW